MHCLTELTDTKQYQVSQERFIVDAGATSLPAVAGRRTSSRKIVHHGKGSLRWERETTSTGIPFDRRSWASRGQAIRLFWLTRTGGTTAFVLVPLGRPPVKTRSTSDSTPLVARGEIASDSSFSRLKSSLTMLVFLAWTESLPAIMIQQNAKISHVLYMGSCHLRSTADQHNSRNLDYRLLFSTIACCSWLLFTVQDYCLLFSTIAYCYRLSLVNSRLSFFRSRLSYVRSRYTFVQFGLPYLGALNFSREMEPIEMRVSNLSIPASQTLINLSSIYRKNSAVLAQKASNRARCGMFALLWAVTCKTVCEQASLALSIVFLSLKSGRRCAKIDILALSRPEAQIVRKLIWKIIRNGGHVRCLSLSGAGSCSSVSVPVVVLGVLDTIDSSEASSSCCGACTSARGWKGFTISAALRFGKKQFRYFWCFTTGNQKLTPK